MADMNAIYKDRLHSKADYLMQLSDPKLANEFITSGMHCEYLKEYTDKIVKDDDGICVWTLRTMMRSAIDNSNILWNQPRYLVPLIRYYESLINTPAIGGVSESDGRMPEVAYRYTLCKIFRWLSPSKFLQAVTKFNLGNDLLASSFTELIRSAVDANDGDNYEDYTSDIEVLHEVLLNDITPVYRVEKMFHTGNMDNLGISHISFDAWGLSDRVPEASQTQGEPLIFGDSEYNLAVIKLLFREYVISEWDLFAKNSDVSRFSREELNTVRQMLQSMYNVECDDTYIRDRAFTTKEMLRNDTEYSIFPLMQTMILAVGKFIEKFAVVLFPDMTHKDMKFTLNVRRFASAITDMKSGREAEKYEDIKGTMEGALLELDELMRDEPVETVARVTPVYNPFGIMTIVPATESTKKNQALESEPETRTKSQQKSVDKRNDKDISREERLHQAAANIRSEVRKGYNDYKRYTDNAKAIDTQVGKIFKNLSKKITNTNGEKYREEILGGKEPSPLKVLGKVLAYAGVFSANPVLGIIALVTRHYNGKKTRRVERRKAMVELQNEMKILDEKIADAQAAGDRKAKYELMRVRNALDSSYDSIKTNMSRTPDKDMLATKKSLINVEVNTSGNK